MEVILREDVPTLGRRGDVVKVAEGYGRNYPAAAGHGHGRERLQQGHDREGEQGRTSRARPRRSASSRRWPSGSRACASSLRARSGENEQLYGSVTSGDVGDFLKGKGIDIDKRKVQLEEPIKKLGDHEVEIKLHPEVVADLEGARHQGRLVGLDEKGPSVRPVE